MIVRPANYAIFSIAVVFVSIIVFPFPIRLLEMYSKAGEYELASQQAEIIARQEGDNRMSLRFWASRADARGDPGQLINYLKRLERVSYEKPLNLQRMAEVYMWSGQPQKAAGVLEEKIRLQPDDKKGLDMLSDLYQVLDQPAKLAAVLEALLRLQPGNSELVQWLLSLYSQLGRVDDELALRLKLLEQKPDDLQNIVRLGGLYLASGKIEPGLKRLEPLLGREKKSRTAAEAVLALIINSGSEAKWRGYKGGLLQAFGGAAALADQVNQESTVQDRAGIGARIATELARENPRQHSILGIAVDLYRLGGQIGLATRMAADVARLNPADPVLARTEAELYLESQDYDGALKALRRLVGIKPDSDQAWEELYKVSSWSENPLDVISARLLRAGRFPKDTQNLDRLVDLARNAERYELAKETLMKLGELKQKDKAYHERMARLDEAIRWKQQDEPKLAMAAPEQSPDGEPHTVQPGEQTEKSAMPQPASSAAGPAEPESTSKPAQAAEFETPAEPEEPALPQGVNELRKLALAKPKDAEVFRAYLDAVQGGQAGKADFDYLHKLVKKTRSPALLRSIGKSLVAADQVLRALPAFEKLARIRPRDPDVRRELAKYYSWHDMPARRLAVLKELAALEPENAGIRLELFEAAIASSDQKIILSLGAWLHGRGKLEPGRSLDLADAYIKAKRLKDALGICRQTLRCKAGAGVLVRAGWMAMDHGQPRLGQALFAKAVKASPGKPEYLKNLALAQMASGQTHRAVLTMQAYTRRKKDYEAHFLLGEILSGLGRKQAAKLEYQKAQTLLAQTKETGR